MSSSKKASTIRRLLIATLLVTAALLLLPSPAHGQTYQFQVTGIANAGEGFFGSGAWAGPTLYGGKFNYWSAWPDGPTDLGVFCQAGKRCDIDLPVQLYYEPEPQNIWACLKATCSQYVSGSVTVSTFSFLTPRSESWEIQVSGAVSINGFISAAYSNGQGDSWELWHASFHGRGTETVRLYAYGDGRYLASYAEANYKGMGSATSEVAEIETDPPVPSGVAYSADSLFVSQAGALGTIRQLSINTGHTLNTFFAPSATGFDGKSTPSDLAFGVNHLFMTDVATPGSGAVYEFDTTGSVIYNRFGLPFRGGALGFGGKRLFVADLDSGQTLVTSRFGATISSFTLPFSPAGMVFDFQRNWLWVLSQTESERVWQFTTKGDQIGSCAGPWSPGLDGVGGITVNGFGRLYIGEIGKLYADWRPGVISGVDASALACNPKLPLSVKVAINPGLPPKPIEPDEGGTILAAILTTETFDAANVDPTTVRFGDTGQEATALDWVLEDVNADGRADLLLRFQIQDTGITCWTNISSVSGQTFAHEAVRGSHSMWTKECRN